MLVNDHIGMDHVINKSCYRPFKHYVTNQYHTAHCGLYQKAGVYFQLAENLFMGIGHMETTRVL